MKGFLGLIKRMIGGRRLIPFFRRPQVATTKVDARAGYRLWAPTYATETAISFLEDEMAQSMLHGLSQTQLLDAGCGIGRRIQDIPGAIGMDLSPEMLVAGGAHNVVAGDVRALPFGSKRFDMVWCRLVLGHLPDPLAAYQEFARVCMLGGYIFVTDFHPDAFAAGHRRTFNAQEGTVHEIEHYVHPNHIQLAAKAGLTLLASREGIVGPSIRNFYASGIGLRSYKRDLGLKLISAFLFHRSNGFAHADHLDGSTSSEFALNAAENKAEAAASSNINLEYRRSGGQNKSPAESIEARQNVG
jgi:malonyl-CoA O-methyltransferase